MKKITILFFALLSVLSVRAADEFKLSYCEHKIAQSGGQGADTSGEISGAIFVPQSKLKALAGNEISRVDVGLISRINVKNLTVWVRTSLASANLTEATIERGVLGWNEVALSDAYKITGNENGLYIGFTYSNAGSSHPVSFVGAGSQGLSFFKSSANDDWKDMAEYGNLSLEAVVTGASLPMYDLSLDRASLTPNIALGQTGYTVSGVVCNQAIKDVTGFTLKVGEANRVEVNTLVKSGATAAFSASFVADKQLAGQVNVSIESLKDGADANLDNNTAMASVAFLRNVVVEEFTTEHCPNCPPAANGFHQALESNELYATRVLPVCHHAGFYTDWLTRQCDKDLLKLYNDNGSSFAPAFMFDRQPIFSSNYIQGAKDNVASLRLKEDFIECIDLVMAQPTHALVGVTINNVRQTAEGAELEVEAHVLVDDDFHAANPILTVYATEDDIDAQIQSGAETGFIHQHVIRWDNGSWGDKVTLANHAFSKNYTIQLDKSWNMEKMHIVAFLSNCDLDNPLNNAIENGAGVDLAGVATGIEEIHNSQSPISSGQAAFTLAGQRVTSGYKGLIVKNGRKLLNK